MPEPTTVLASLDTADVQVGLEFRGARPEKRRHGLLGFHQQVLQVEERDLWHHLVNECGSNSGFAATPRTPDAVHVVLELVRHVKIDHVLDVWEVKPLASDIGGHQNVLPTVLKGFDREVTFLLVFPTVDCHGLDPLEQQVLVHVINIALLLAEDEHGWGCLLQALEQVHDLGFLLDVLHLLDHIEIGGAGAAHIDRDRVDQRRVSEIFDLDRHGRREEDHLPLAFKVRHNLTHVLLALKINHAVCLIQRKIAAHFERESPSLQHVLQPPRGRHHNVRSHFPPHHPADVNLPHH
mmetsp:Transcript_20389/g.52985  ORF Transcript_20389/g.52985 Transcript_20389/m.52985 type:complete len:294 (+) Transcript_20389:200-1081(+)